MDCYCKSCVLAILHFAKLGLSKRYLLRDPGRLSSLDCDLCLSHFRIHKEGLSDLGPDSGALLLSRLTDSSSVRGRKKKEGGQNGRHGFTEIAIQEVLVIMSRPGGMFLFFSQLRLDSESRWSKTARIR